MNNIIHNITQYILFLKYHCGLSVSLHPLVEKESTIVSSEFTRFYFHNVSYCAFIKENTQARKHCLECQKKVYKACDKGHYSGTCYAGVRERIYPITDGNVNTGFISVSGYRTENADSYFQKLSEKYGFSLSELESAYESLEPQFPNEEDLDTLLFPLCHMLELAYRKDEKKHQPLTFIQQVEQYIKQNRNQDITSQTICEHFSCSRSYMSTQFNKITEKTLRQYINDLRIADAKELLKNTNLSVTEIAYSIGFNSSHYFSKQFMQSVKQSPLQFRKSTR